MRTLCNVISVLILAAFVVMAAGSLESEESTEKASQSPDLMVSARQLYSDYKSNEVAADQRYKGKTLLVTGNVDNIGKDIMNTMYVTLIGNGAIGRVQCFFATSHEDDLAGLRKGMSVSVKGRCDGKMMNVLMRGCTLER